MNCQVLKFQRKGSENDFKYAKDGKISSASKRSLPDFSANEENGHCVTPIWMDFTSQEM